MRGRIDAFFFFISYQVTTRIFNACHKKNHVKTLHKMVNMPIICI